MFHSIKKKSMYAHIACHENSGLHAFNDCYLMTVHVS
jgi:hypothetical protein